LRRACHLLTLLGPGGIGKTRLALAVVEAVADQFLDGVCYLDLTQVSEAAAVPSLLSAKFGLRVEEGAPLRRVTDYLAEQQLLLVLDNCEHVLPIALMVSELLEACPDLTVLATSREPLRLGWEQRFVVSPLGLPDLHQLPPADELRTFPAVELFLQRARAISLQYAVDDATLQQIAVLCVRLEGVPLAIELAAARITVLSPAAMLHRLDGSLALLQQRAPDVPARHESIQATLDWSYELLSGPEQTGFRRLGVFVGGFSLEAAEAVMRSDGPFEDTLEILSSLSDKSLITVDPTSGDDPRYHQFDTVRSYAQERLEKVDEVDVIGLAHARYFASLAESERLRIRTSGPVIFAPDAGPSAKRDPRRPAWPVLLDRDAANLEAALAWAGEHEDETTFVRLAVALAPYWWMRGLMREGTQRLERALSYISGAEPVLRSRALDGLGVLYRQQADFEQARSVLEESVALARTFGDRQVLAAYLIDLGSVLAFQQHSSEAARLFEQAAELARAADDTWALAVALTYPGVLSLLDRRPQEAETQFRISLALFRDIGDLRAVMIVALYVARTIGMQGDLRRALPFLAEALSLCREFGRETLTALAFEVTACLMSAEGSPEACARLLGAGEALRSRGYARTPEEHEMYEEALVTLAGRLDQEMLAAALKQGKHLAANRALVEAEGLVESALSSPDDATTAPHRSDGEPLSPREREVLTLLVEGCSNREIGRRLGISENTVKAHVTSIYDRLGINGRAAAVSVAVRRGLVE
jgi:non-specific serine/threonine protein kinase